MWSPSSGALNSEVMATLPAEEGDEDGSLGPHPVSFILGTEANIVTHNKK